MVDDILLHGAVHNLAEVSSLFLSLSLSLPALLCQPESLACVFGGQASLFEGDVEAFF